MILHPLSHWLPAFRAVYSVALDIIGMVGMTGSNAPNVDKVNECGGSLVEELRITPSKLFDRFK